MEMTQDAVIRNFEVIGEASRNIERHYPDPDRELTEWARQFLSQDSGTTDTEEFLLAVTTGIRDGFAYRERNELGVQIPTETLRLGGTCRDFALFMMEAVRSVGIAARFVSGYLYDPAIDGMASDVTGSGSTHAWVQVYLPGAGWIEFDPTNGSYGGHNLVPVAVAREPDQAIPVSGSFLGASDDFISMSVDVTVRSLSTTKGAA